MKKWFLLFLLVPSVAFAGFSVDGITDPASVDGIDTPASVDGIDSDYSTECLAYYTKNDGNDGNRYIGRYNDEDITGGIFTPTTGVCVCAIDFRVDTVTGTLGASHDYYFAIYALSGTTLVDPTTNGLGVSSKLDGSAFVGGTFISANAGLATFGTCINLTGSTPYAIGVFPDQDGNTTDDPEYDGSNYPSWSIDNENNGGYQLVGRYSWKFSDGSLTNSDVEDDLLIIIHTEQ